MGDYIIDGTGNGYPVKVGSDNRIWVDSNITNQSGTAVITNIYGTISDGNSSNTPIVANGSFVGTWEEVKDYSMIYVNIRADQDSQNEGNYGLNLEFSQDAGSGGIDVCEEYFYESGGKGIFSVQPSARYFRVNYINGADTQGLFRLQTQYKQNYGKPSSHRIDEPINDQNDAELTKAVITGKKPDNTYVNFEATNGGNFKQSLEEYESDFFLGSPLPVRIYDSYTNGSIVGPLAIDDSTFSTQTIEYEHHEIHEGSHYFVAGFDTVDSGNSLTFCVDTPNTSKWTHINYSVEGTSRTEFYVYEGGDYSGGAPVMAYNNNRNSTNTTGMAISGGCVVNTSSGTRLIASSKGLGGATPSKGTITAVQSRNREIILKSGTSYMFEIKSVDDGNIIDYEAEWYEHTDKIQKW